MEVRGEESVNRSECGMLVEEEWLQLVEEVVGGGVGDGCSGGGLLCTVCILWGAVLCTCVGVGWLFTVYTGWAALSTVITGHCCCFTI